MKIIYAEASPRPRPSEVTYIPRASIREYDYYVVALIEHEGQYIPLPMLVEELSDEREFGGKTAIDKLIGLGTPVMFVVNRTVADSRREVMRYAASSSMTTPIIVNEDAWNVLKPLIEAKTRKSIYIELSAPEFWDELQEAHVAYAPSIRLKFLHKPLRTLSELALKELGNDEKADKVFWKTLRWRETVHVFIHGFPQQFEVTKLEPEEDVIEMDSASGCKLLGCAYEEIERIVDECNEIRIHIPIPSIDDVLKLYGILKDRLRQSNNIGVPPEIESLAFLVLGIAAVAMYKDRRPEIKLFVHHDYSYDDPKACAFFEVMEKIRCELQEFFESIGSIGFSMYFENPYNKRLVEVESKEIIGFENGDCCHIVMVRDTSKKFLHALLERIYTSKAKKAFFVYVPTEVRISVEVLNAASRSTLVSSSMPTKGILLIFKEGFEFLKKLKIERLLKDEKALYKKLVEIVKSRDLTVLKAFLKSFRLGILCMNVHQHR